MNRDGIRTLGVGWCRTLALALVLVPTLVWGQELLGSSQRRQATRAELEQALAGAEAAAAVAEPRTREALLSHAASIRQRLRNGDFSPGDRLHLVVAFADSIYVDTVTVRPDQSLAFRKIPPISLRGVLDSEASEHLTKELSKFIKNPEVTATGLLRLQVMGAVQQPQFLTVPMSQLITDVIMAAGGPSQGSKFSDTRVTRAGKTFLDHKQFAEAIRTGKTVGDVSLRDGDEIFVPVGVQGGSRFQQGLAIMTGLVSIFWIIRFAGGRTP